MPNCKWGLAMPDEAKASKRARKSREFPDLRQDPKGPFSIEHAMAVVMGNKPEAYRLQRQLFLYVLLIWARFPELRGVLSNYQAQGALRLASNDWLGEPGDKPKSSRGTELLRLNLGTSEFVKMFEHPTGLADASGAWPADDLDRRLIEPADFVEQRMVLARFLITALRARPQLLLRKNAQVAFVKDIMGMGRDFWATRRRSKSDHDALPSGGPECTAFSNVWDGAGESLLIQHLLWPDVPRFQHAKAERPADDDDEIPVDEIEDDEDDTSSCLNGEFRERLDSPTLFAEFFEKKWENWPKSLNEARSIFWQYRTLIAQFQACSPTPRTVLERWTPCNEAWIWGERVAGASTAFAGYTFSTDQQKIALAVLAGNTRIDPDVIKSPNAQSSRTSN